MLSHSSSSSLSNIESKETNNSKNDAIEKIQEIYTDFLKELHTLHAEGNQEGVEKKLVESKEIMLYALESLLKNCIFDRFPWALAKQSTALKILKTNYQLPKEEASFHLKRITHADTYRTMQDLPKGTNRRKVFRPAKVTDKSTMEEVVIERKISIERGLPKKTIFSKKTPVTTASYPGNVQLFGYIPGVAIAVDLDLCFVKPDSIFDGNMATNTKWHLEGTPKHKEALQSIQTHKASTRAKIHDQQKKDFEAKIESQQNEMLPSIPLIAVVAIVALTREKFLDEKKQEKFKVLPCLVGDKMNALYFNHMLRELAYEQYPLLLKLWQQFPTYLLQKSANPIKYSVHEQLQDIEETLTNPRRVIAKEAVRKLRECKPTIYSPAVDMYFKIKEGCEGDPSLLEKKIFIKDTLIDDPDFAFFTEKQKEIISAFDLEDKLELLEAYTARYEPHEVLEIVYKNNLLPESFWLYFLNENTTAYALHKTFIKKISSILMNANVKESKTAQIAFDAILQKPVAYGKEKKETSQHLLLSIIMGNIKNIEKCKKIVQKISPTAIRDLFKGCTSLSYSAEISEIFIEYFKKNFPQDQVLEIFQLHHPCGIPFFIKEQFNNILNVLLKHFTSEEVLTFINTTNYSFLDTTQKIQDMFNVLLKHFPSKELLPMLQNKDISNAVFEGKYYHFNIAENIKAIFPIVDSFAREEKSPSTQQDMFDKIMQTSTYYNNYNYEISFLGYLFTTLDYKQSIHAILSKISSEKLQGILKNIPLDQTHPSYHELIKALMTSDKLNLLNAYKALYEPNQVLEILHKNNLLPDLFLLDSFNRNTPVYKLHAAIIKSIFPTLLNAELQENKKAQAAFDAILQKPVCYDTYTNIIHCNVFSHILMGETLELSEKIIQKISAAAIPALFKNLNLQNITLLEQFIEHIKKTCPEQMFNLLKTNNPFDSYWITAIKTRINNMLTLLLKHLTKQEIIFLMTNVKIRQLATFTEEIQNIFNLLYNHFLPEQLLSLLHKGYISDMVFGNKCKTDIAQNIKVISPILQSIVYEEKTDQTTQKMFDEIMQIPVSHNNEQTNVLGYLMTTPPYNEQMPAFIKKISPDIVSASIPKKIKMEFERLIMQRLGMIDVENTPELPIKREPQPLKAYLPTVAILNRDLIADYLNLKKDYKTSARLSRSCVQLYSIYQPGLTKRHLQLRQQFLQAVVDDKIEKVKNILDTYPGLLLDKPKEELVIESKYTWLRWNLKGENALTIAAKQRKIEMLEALLPYIYKLQDHKLAEKTKADILSNWPSYEYKEEKDEFNIPPEYLTDLQTMIDVFKNETFPNGRGIEAKLSEKTELALQQFRSKILPENAVTLNESIQAELFLYAAYKVYDDNFCNDDPDEPQDFDNRSAYCRTIIGFAQSLLSPKDAEKWCEGLYYVVEEKRPISDRARLLNLLVFDKRVAKNAFERSQKLPFHRTARDSFSALGGKYYCGQRGHQKQKVECGWDLDIDWCEWEEKQLLKKLCQAKTEAMHNLCISQTIGHALKIV